MVVTLSLDGSNEGIVSSGYEQRYVTMPSKSVDLRNMINNINLSRVKEFSRLIEASAIGILVIVKLIKSHTKDIRIFQVNQLMSV